MNATDEAENSAPTSPSDHLPSEERTAIPKRQIPGWAPLRSPLFRAIWLASLASNIGSWMHDVGASWLMTSLTKDEQLNALVSAASSFPMFMLALPAGALADIVDRRKLVICTQTWMCIVAGTLAALTLFGLRSPYILLFFTLLMALGSAMTGPAWQALLPEMVKRRQLPVAMSLGGVAWNLSRIIGPLLGGAIISVAARVLPDRAAAPGVVFAVNAISFLTVVGVFIGWKRAPRENSLPAEHFITAIRTGWRYTRHSPELRAILVRIGAYMTCLVAQFSLLPLYARQLLHLDAGGYALLLSFFGAAAVGANLLYPRVRERFTPPQILFGSTLASAFSLLVLAVAPDYAPQKILLLLVHGAMLFGGIGWPLVMQTCNVTLIRSVPDWVRSRAAGMFSLIFMGSSTLGSIFWGGVARENGIPLTFAFAALGLLAGLVVLRGFVVVDPGNTNFSASGHWADPVIAFEPSPQDGPVLITTEYEIAPAEAEAFVAAMHAVRRLRLRDGALRWTLFQDMAEPTLWMESFLVESWHEHLRQHARITYADREVEELGHSFHRGSAAPRVKHLLAASARPKPENESDDENSDDDD
ncbi:putative arabinose efflux permease, MFS family [Abditibacterium utsteinense]|uniref:Putative arabinose efflux permease, MFS family n=1 Tax=Abditibacterium utsteinense TaxID=1960156 RepID=A0A2S8SS49_9BACT|nr:MFS transporter [Abditibacterium utsteinense]PQV63559.1 putative arabinose efflux permease, MFS family [Abditibacterium utsteinense]